MEQVQICRHTKAHITEFSHWSLNNLICIEVIIRIGVVREILCVYYKLFSSHWKQTATSHATHFHGVETSSLYPACSGQKCSLYSHMNIVVSVIRRGGALLCLGGMVPHMKKEQRRVQQSWVLTFTTQWWDDGRGTDSVSKNMKTLNRVVFHNCKMK